MLLCAVSSFLFTTGTAWNMTGSEYNASIHLQVTLFCIVWFLLSCRFLLPSPLVLPITTGNAWNMTASEYNASIYLQVTLRCIVCLLLCFCFLLSPPLVVLPITTGNVWNMTASEYNAAIHLQVTLRCIVWLLLRFCFFLPPPHVVLPFTTVIQEPGMPYLHGFISHEWGWLCVNCSNNCIYICHQSTVHTYVYTYIRTYVLIYRWNCVWEDLNSHLLCTDGHHALLSVLCVQGLLLRALHYEGERV